MKEEKLLSFKGVWDLLFKFLEKHLEASKFSVWDLLRRDIYSRMVYTIESRICEH